MIFAIHATVWIILILAGVAFIGYIMNFPLDDKKEDKR